MHSELANMPLLHIMNAISCMLVQVPDALDVICEPRKQTFPYTTHTMALKAHEATY